MRTGHPPVVVTVITAPESAALIRGQLQYLKDRGFEAVLVSSAGPKVRELARSEKVRLFEVAMRREPDPIRDLGSLIGLIRLFRHLKPAIVNAGTPKAGLLGTLAAWICRVPVRIYTLRGFRHESASGLGRVLLMWNERLVSSLANVIVCISPSVRDLGVTEGLVPASKAVVFGPGSSNGIDLARFDPATVSPSRAGELATSLGLDEAAEVVGFVGRLIPRKGVTELIEAWPAIQARHPQARLLLVGPYEDAQPLLPKTRAAIANDRTIIEVGPVSNVAEFYAIMDVFALPAHWEGFGNVLIEAAAMQIPVVTTDGTGTRDAVRHDFNGTVVPVGDVGALREAICRYLAEPSLRQEHGRNGRAWAGRFRRDLVWSQLADLYHERLKPLLAGAHIGG